MRHPDPPAAGPAAGRIPRHIDVVAEGAFEVGVGGDHGLVVEVVLATGEGKEGDVRVRHPTVAGTRHRHLGAVDGAFASAVAEEDNNVAVKHVSTCVEG